MRSCIQFLHGVPLNKSVPSISDMQNALSTENRRRTHDEKNGKHGVEQRTPSNEKQKCGRIVWDIGHVYIYTLHTHTHIYVHLAFW